MRHYEIVFLVHPDRSDQVKAMIDRYKSLVESRDGKIHRLENWGMRKLMYSIKQAYKAYYVLMNIECDRETLAELSDVFRFNDAVIRNLIIKRDRAVTEASPIAALADHENPDEVPGEVPETANKAAVVVENTVEA